MEINAYTKTIGDILSQKKKYIIPRFQREYSWEKSNLSDLLNDILEQIVFLENKCDTSDYFIGALVLVGKETDASYQVVDGQQRLTTLTIIFSVLTHIFKQLKKYDLQNGCYEYVEGKDNDFNPFFKLENESPKPFFQRRIQNKDIDLSYEGKTSEEKRLLKAYMFLKKSLNEKLLRKRFAEIDKDATDVSYIDLLKAIRDQCTRLTVVFITVGKLVDANTIFETLNAKGKDLEPLDLIKNEIFKILNSEHPSDEAKDIWRKIKHTLYACTKEESMTIFLRHFWLSKYRFIPKAKIYSSFLTELPKTEEAYNQFLKELDSNALLYRKIISPKREYWKRNEKKFIYDSLSALQLFNVSQHRPLVLALLNLEENNSKYLKNKTLKKFLTTLENFHFMFTAITSSRASDLERLYSKIAIKISKSTSSADIENAFEELLKSLSEKIPTYKAFESSFEQLEYEKDNNNALIKYILCKLDLYHSDSAELVINDYSIEHIANRSSAIKNCNKIGNLLPLSQEINSRINTSVFVEKLPHYKKSSYPSVKKFLEEYGELKAWTEQSIDARTTELSELSYNNVWKLNSY